MDALQFTYWLNGFAELSGDEPPTPAQWRSIKEHLGLVFQKVTPAVAPGVIQKGGPLHTMQQCTSAPNMPLRAECVSTAMDGANYPQPASFPGEGYRKLMAEWDLPIPTAATTC